MSKPTPFAILNALTDEQLDVLLSLNNEELGLMLTSITYSRVAKRLWGNREVTAQPGWRQP